MIIAIVVCALATVLSLAVAVLLSRRQHRFARDLAIYMLATYGEMPGLVLKERGQFGGPFYSLMSELVEEGLVARRIVGGGPLRMFYPQAFYALTNAGLAYVHRLTESP
jgi:hypothetical protein